MKRHLAIVLAALLVPCSAIFADDAKLPPAKELLERYIEAIGGQAAVDKNKSAVAKMNMEIRPVGVNGTLTIYSDHPKVLVAGEIQGVGEIAEGTDGEVFWERTAVTGPRLLEGKEKRLKQLGYADYKDYDKFVEKMETVGLEEVEGKPAYKVVMTLKELDPVTLWYDKSSGLVVKSAFVMDSPMVGRINIETNIGDYRPINGVKAPHRIVQKMLNIEQVMTVQSIETGVEHPPGRFDLPADIKQLVERKKQQESGAASP